MVNSRLEVLTNTPEQTLKRNGHAFMVVGAIVTLFASIQRSIVESIRLIEHGDKRVRGRRLEPDSDQRQELKKQKSHLRCLIEKHGTTQDVKDLDANYRLMEKIKAFRHGVSHAHIGLGDSDDPGEGDPDVIEIYGWSDEPGKTIREKYRLSEMMALYRELHDVPFHIKHTAHDIWGAFMRKDDLPRD